MESRRQGQPQPSSLANMSPSHTKLLLTVEEAASRLSLGRSTVYELLAAGRIASIQVGRARRIPVTSLEIFIESQLSLGDQISA